MGARTLLHALFVLMLAVAAVGIAGHCAQAADTTVQQNADRAALHSKVRQLHEDQKLDEARAVAEKGLEAAEHAKPADEAEVMWWLFELGAIYEDLGQYTKAEPYLVRALALAERLYGPNSSVAIIGLRNLAGNERDQGRFSEAEARFKRALAISEGQGQNGLDVASSLNDLAELYLAQGRYGEAEPLLKRALGILEAVSGPQSLYVSSVVSNLGFLCANQARFAEAEAYFKRAIEIQKYVHGSDHPLTARALARLGLLYQMQGRFSEAEPLLLGSCDMLQKTLSPTHPIVAACTASAAAYLHQVQRYALAEQYYRRALEAYSKVLGGDAPEVGNLLTNFGQLLIDTDRLAEAETMLQRAVSVLKKAFGVEHPDTGRAIGALAQAEIELGKFGEAEANLRRAIAGVRKSLPSLHPDLEQHLASLAVALLAHGKPEEAFAAAKEAAAIEVALQASSANAELKGMSHAVAAHEAAFQQEVRAAYALAQAQPAREQVLRDAGFGAAQYLAFDETGRAVGQMASRFAARDDPLGRLLHEQQDLLRRLRALNQLIATAIGSPDTNTHAQASELRRESEAISARLQEIDARLRREDPAYADLADPRPISLAETQSLLSDNEGLVLVLSVVNDTYLFAISRSQIAWAHVPVTRLKLEEQVRVLRLQVDKTTWQEQMAPFDRSLAYTLYQEVLAPVDRVFKDKANLFVVATGPLTSLPFAMLVTEPPAGGAAGDRDPEALRQTAWLIKRQASVTLPSVSSLRALRLYADKRSGSEAFAGFGDPVFDDTARDTRRVSELSRFFRGDQPILGMLRTLPRLKATGDEVRAMARILGAPDSDVYVRERATETQIKTRDLSRKRIIEIATHGLVAGDFSYAEPGLAFTPPNAATDLDDGYLASSEAARLNLHADMVILSACDTAAGEVPGANGLSGLARAFILAGTKSLLASHWAIDDQAAMLLTTRTVLGIQKSPARGRAEALRQAMLSVMNEPGDPVHAHPVTWAPFVLVGEPRVN